MRRFVLIVLLAAGALAWPTSPDHPDLGARPGHASGIEPDGLLVLAVLSPERAVVADPRTGETRERRVPGGTFCHGPLLAVGDRVVLSGLRGSRPVARSLPLSLTGAGRPLGAADTVMVASAVPGRVWLGRWTRLGTRAARVSLREVDAAGRPVARATARILRWGLLEGVVDDGFVLSDEHGLTLRRGAAESRSFRGAWMLATGGSRFAWCRPGDAGCRRIRIWSADSDRTLEPPTGVRLPLGGDASFSPDGRRLALPVRTGGRDRVAVVDVASGRWTVAHGARLADYRSIAWSPSGRWLYFTGSRDRVLGWRVGAAEPVALPIRPDGTVMSIATTDAPAL
ncbi:MAG TPA: hypothetical protein VK631_09475 [Solirubrobacteraceae bacterium]|nr:hypothetical protein [Solirubrobacteraceae bacterium]